jgi:mono/diheme cytochrome c family protein
MKKIISLLLILINISNATEQLKTGEEVFRAYCWGCHHQTSMAFGPSFQQIAQTRTKDQMITHIMAPKSDFIKLGYKRSVMPNFSNTLSNNEINLIIDFINSCKELK